MGFEEACLVGALHPEAMHNNQISLSLLEKSRKCSTCVLCVSCEDVASSKCVMLCLATNYSVAQNLPAP